MLAHVRTNADRWIDISVSTVTVSLVPCESGHGTAAAHLLQPLNIPILIISIPIQALLFDAGHCPPLPLNSIITWAIHAHLLTMLRTLLMST